MFSGSMINLFCVTCKHPIHDKVCEILIDDEPELICGCGEEDDEQQNDGWSTIDNTTGSDGAKFIRW